MKTLEKIARQTHDLRIFTDGERRYGNLLFELCYDLVKDGRPGRPKKTFTRGVHVRVKNKGSQAHKKGPKRPKYQSPWKEHPETARTIVETDIHANHAEAFFRALRRKCATFRRKTNTYAKATTGLQRLLWVYWVVHNFLRVHFTTNWLRVLDTAERSQVDQRVRHQLHPIVALLDALKTQQQPLAFVLPCKGSLDTGS